MDELISVIVPVYKAEACLEDCVRSILGQTYPALELILVDDGSPDNSGTLCDAWAERDERIRVIHQKNAGPGAARNAGMEAAKGTCLSFVDSDDTVCPEFLEELHGAMAGVQMAICGIDSEEEASADLQAETIGMERLAVKPSRYAAPVYVNSCFNKLYRTEIIRETGLHMDTSMRRAEDLCFVTQYLLQCRAIRVVPQKLYRYRRNPESITHTYYRGIAGDEIKGWQMQQRLFAPDRDLSREEREFFSVWKYGKIQAILRYILACAPSAGQARREISQLLQDPQIQGAYTDPEVCRRLGRKKIVYACLAKRGLYGLLHLLFRIAGVG